MVEALVDDEETALLTDDRVVLAERRAFGAEVGYQHRWSRALDVTATYRYRTEDGEAQSRIDGHGFFVAATYRLGNSD
jgi:hypothetical protein